MVFVCNVCECVLYMVCGVYAFVCMYVLCAVWYVCVGVQWEAAGSSQVKVLPLGKTFGAVLAWMFPSMLRLQACLCRWAATFIAACSLDCQQGRDCSELVLAAPAATSPIWQLHFGIWLGTDTQQVPFCPKLVELNLSSLSSGCRLW